MTYDVESDTLIVVFREGASVHESDEVTPGFIVDVGQDGDVVSIEVLDASNHISDPRRVDFRLEE